MNGENEEMTRVEPQKVEVVMSTRYVGVAILLLCFAFSVVSHAQDVTDKTVASIDGDVKTELITYSDLVWQLALQPGTPLVSPSSEKLNEALHKVIDQRLILQEADRLPGMEASDAEVTKELNGLVGQFPSQTEFQSRVTRVGLTADQLREIVRRRVVIEKYLDFRFRSFTVVTPAEVTDYYNRVWVPRFKRQSPGQIVPTLDQARSQIESALMESKVESQIDQFLESARERAEITILYPV
jgi:SurA N-terminal domain